MAHGTIRARMIALIQRVTSASIAVDDRITAAIGRGVLALLAVRADDSPASADYLIERILGYRIFADDAGRMNRSLADIAGGLLLVPQFTLAADTRKGTRPGFSTAAAPALAAALFEHCVTTARARHREVESGAFGAHMAVSLVNDGPATFWLETPFTT